MEKIYKENIEFFKSVGMYETYEEIQDLPAETLANEYYDIQNNEVYKELSSRVKELIDLIYRTAIEVAKDRDGIECINVSVNDAEFRTY